jgi:hypothetical protein
MVRFRLSIYSIKAPELIQPTAALDDLDDPLQPASTSDRAPLVGNMQDSSSSSRGGAAGISQSYLTSAISGEDRRAATNTIDESVWDTLSRDLKAVGEKMKQVLWPKYLLGGVLVRGGGGIAGDAERGESGAARGPLGRWPDADTVLEGTMSEGLRDWDLWYAALMSFGQRTTDKMTGDHYYSVCFSASCSREEQGKTKSQEYSLAYSPWFGLESQWSHCRSSYWEATCMFSNTGQCVPQANEIDRSFFQAVCIIGYTLFPLVIASLLSSFGLPTIARIPVYIVLVAWSTAAGVSILGGSGVLKNRVGLAIYPLFVFYIAIGCLCFLT